MADAVVLEQSSQLLFADFLVGTLFEDEVLNWFEDDADAFCSGSGTFGNKRFQAAIALPEIRLPPEECGAGNSKCLFHCRIPVFLPEREDASALFRFGGNHIPEAYGIS